AEGEEAGEEETGPTPEQKILEMDIKTSSLGELAAWCRSLGLSEGGSREQMMERLRGYYELPPPPGAGTQEEDGDSKRKNIIIESARNTEYFTLQTVDEEYARLTGNVVLTLSDGDTNYRIQAEEILFNRTRNIISASGSVEFLRDDGNTKETFRGEQVTVDLDNWASVFMDSVSERSMGSDENVFRFSGSLITRSDEKATILTDAKITNGSSEEAFWSIDASKLWLLPGNDWAFFNAVLKVGEIPVLWLPVFFYPSDEIIFHPVFGYRSREGNFVQTTTYLFGRPRAKSSSEASSITKIMGGNTDDEKEQHGIFLRSTGKKNQDPNEKRLSFMLDSYANMGIYTGTEFTLPSTGSLSSLSISGGLGFTRNVYQINNSYTPFPHNDSVSEWNTSRLFSITVPFRYRLDSSASFILPGGRLSLTFPFYSDIYVTRDFMDRAEEMDWFNMIKQGNNQGTDADTDLTQNLLGYYDWRISGSFNPRLDFLNPYVSSISISNISSTLAFRHRNSAYWPSAVNTTDILPDRIFYYPDKLTILSLSASIQGTPLSLGGNRNSGSGAAETTPEYDDPFKGIGTPYSPWKEDEEEEAGAQSDLPYDLKPPELAARFNIPIPGGGPSFDVHYRLAPSGASEMQFRSSAENWPDAREVDWSEISSVLNTVRGDGNLGFTLQSSGNSLYTIGVQAFGNGAWQDYSMMNEDAEEFDTVAERNSALRRNYNATNFNTTGEGTLTVRPFFWNDIFANTNFQYSLRGLLAKSVFEDQVLAAGEEIGDPEYTIEYGEWTKEKLDTHLVRAQISALVMDHAQDVSVSLDLPPRDSSLYNAATMRIWISETSFNQRINKPFDTEERLFLPMTFTESLRFSQNYSFSQNVVYDPELDDFTSLNSSLQLHYVRVGYTMSRYRPYDLTNRGWEVKPGTDETFNPREFRAEYSQTYAKQELWKDRISFRISVGSSLSLDLQRYTYSKFLFNFSFTLGITKFLDISFNTSSENAVVFRYIQDLPVFGFEGEIPGEKNVFIDLINSFRFDNEILRRSSGFKLKSFGLSLTHHLGDWTAKLDWRLSPYLDTSGTPPYSYRFNNEISFVVQWIPISEAKTEITYNKDVFEIK
ncbi:MAG: LPS-assembly protein LptD, partial [Treponema sp.]|nr:LPS-assembly protein LptD [Treponema sp.]